MPMLYRELQQLGLESNVAELETFGFTVVPPEKVGPPELLKDVKKALEKVVEKRFGKPNDKGDSWAEKNDIMRYILWEDEIFEKLILNPAGLGLIQYLVGTNCIQSLCDGWVKGPGKNRTGIHCDWTDPSRRTFPPEPNHANINYLVTDYSKELGSISYLPGSHKWRRMPSPQESNDLKDQAYAIEAPAGSMLVWGDHTWHGSYPRTVPGERMMILMEYCRPRLQAQEPFRESVSQAALDRNPIRFSGLMDVYGLYPFGKNDRDYRAEGGPPGTGTGLAAKKYCSLFDTEPAAGQTSLRPKYEYSKHDGMMVYERYMKSREKRKKLKADGQSPY